jgi:hypothetical protein
MAGSVVGSHLVRPIGSKKAKAAARSGTPCSSLEESPHPPTVSVAMAADELTATLGKISGRTKKKKGSLKMKAKIWETMVFYKKHASAKKVAEELWAYNMDDEEEEEDKAEDKEGSEDECQEDNDALDLEYDEGECSPHRHQTNRIFQSEGCKVCAISVKIISVHFEPFHGLEE